MAKKARPSTKSKRAPPTTSRKVKGKFYFGRLKRIAIDTKLVYATYQ